MTVFIELALCLYRFPRNVASVHLDVPLTLQRRELQRQTDLKDLLESILQVTVFCPHSRLFLMA